MRGLAVLAAAALLPAPALGCQGLEADAPWIRAAAPGVTMTAGYARLRNTGRETLRVDGGRSSAFGAVELHRTVVENGMSRMRHGEPLVLAPGASAALEPGGWHLMLMQPARALERGDRVVLALTCGAAAREFTFTVKASE